MSSFPCDTARESFYVRPPSSHPSLSLPDPRPSLGTGSPKSPLHDRKGGEETLDSGGWDLLESSFT